MRYKYFLSSLLWKIGIICYGTGVLNFVLVLTLGNKIIEATETNPPSMWYLMSSVFIYMSFASATLLSAAWLEKKGDQYASEEY